jgi:hypothetical protein
MCILQAAEQVLIEVDGLAPMIRNGSGVEEDAVVGE